MVGTVRDAGKAKVVPLSKVSIAFGAGLAGAGGKAEKDGGGSDAGLEGGGAGGALLVEPKAFVVVGEDGVPHMLALNKGKHAVLRKGLEILPETGAQLAAAVNRAEARRRQEEVARRGSVSTLAIALSVAALVAVGLASVPVRLRFTLQARGEPSGFWALAGGAQVGPLAASGVAAKGVPAHLNLHAFGKKLWHKRLAELAAPKAEDDQATPKPPALARAEAGYQRLERWLDPGDLLFFLVGERRRIVLEPTLIELEYGFRDIARRARCWAPSMRCRRSCPRPSWCARSPTGRAPIAPLWPLRARSGCGQGCWSLTRPGT